MNNLPPDMAHALRVWEAVRHHYCGQRIRYIGKSRPDWPQRGDIGTIVDLATQDSMGISPFIISWPDLPFNIQPALDSIEFLGIV